LPPAVAQLAVQMQLGPALSAPVGGIPGVAMSPGASGMLPAAVAAAAAAAAATMNTQQQQQQQMVGGGQMPAGLISPERLLMMPDAAAAAAAGLSSGPPRVKRTAKRLGMPRCFSSKNIAGGSIPCCCWYRHTCAALSAAPALPGFVLLWPKLFCCPQVFCCCWGVHPSFTQLPHTST
jgi:hypothetical protein